MHSWNLLVWWTSYLFCFIQLIFKGKNPSYMTVSKKNKCWLAFWLFFFTSFMQSWFYGRNHWTQHFDANWIISPLFMVSAVYESKNCYTPLLASFFINFDDIIKIIIKIIIIIIAFKGAIRDFYNLLSTLRTVSNFYNLLSTLRTVSNTYARVAQAQSWANHVQYIKRLSCATCRVMCHVVQRESSAVKFDRV